MKKYHLIPILTLLPVLFMANSPYPYSNGDVYEDFKCNAVSYASEKEDGYYKTQLTIENYGSQYLSLSSINLFDKAGEESDEATYLGDVSENIYWNWLLPPNTSMDVEAMSRRNDVTLENLTVKGFAFAPLETPTYKSITYSNEEKADAYYSDTSFYIYTFDVNGLRFSDEWYYTLIIDYEIGGVKYAQRQEGSTLGYIRLNSPTKLEDPQNELTVTGMSLVRGMNKRNRYSQSLWITIWIVVAIALFLGFLASLIVVPLVLFTKKPWRKVK